MIRLLFEMSHFLFLSQIYLSFLIVKSQLSVIVLCSAFLMTNDSCLGLIICSNKEGLITLKLEHSKISTLSTSSAMHIRCICIWSISKWFRSTS